MAILKVMLTIVIVSSTTVCAFSSNRTAKAICDEWKVRTSSEHPECFASSGVKMEYVNQYWDTMKMEDDQSFKCYMDCLFKNFKWTNDDGTANKAVIVQSLDRITNDIMDACVAKVDDTWQNCERAYELLYCLVHYHHTYL